MLEQDPEDYLRGGGQQEWDYSYSWGVSDTIVIVFLLRTKHYFLDKHKNHNK